MRKREEVPVEDTWRLEDLLASDQEWEELYERTQKRLEEYADFRGHLSESSGKLLSCLKLDEELSLLVERLFVYGKQKSDQDAGNQKYQDYAAKARMLSCKAGELSSYIVPEILEMDTALLEKFRSENRELDRYQRTLHLILKRKEHTLPADMEELLAKSYEATQGPSQIFNMFNHADIKFPAVTGPDGDQIVITHGNYIALMESENRDVRKSAFAGLYSVYRQFSNTLAAAFYSNVRQAAFYAKARHYPSSRSHALAENEIPEQVYDNLLKAVHDHLPLLHRYVKLRKKALGLDELHMYDLYVPILSSSDRKYSFDEAKSMVEEGLSPLGEEYLSVLREGFQSRWIDVYENEGKRSGAYSWGAYGTHPYVLLNFNGTLDHVFTLAHEMGHAIHSYFSDKNQSYLDAGYKIFVAEVASTCNEALLIRSMLKRTKDKRERCHLINHFLESFRATLFRQAMFAEFEAEVHSRAEAGEPLTSELLCMIYRMLNEKYFGPQIAVDSDIDFEWARIPHFYTPFYVYQYATGFSAAVAISSKILSGSEEALRGYLKFLSGGNIAPPIELLKLCGVDMSDPEPVDEALKVFEELLNEIEILIGEIR